MVSVMTAPTLHLTVGLPGAGKTTLARSIEAATGALRLSPDEWMRPLFGESEADGKRDVLEGRLIWVGHRVLRGGLSVVLDFGCWSREERHALRDVAQRSGASFRLHYLSVPEAERRARAETRWREAPASELELGSEDHDRFLAGFVAPDESELGADSTLPPPPPPFATWPAWASDRWPSLPRLDLG